MPNSYSSVATVRGPMRGTRHRGKQTNIIADRFRLWRERTDVTGWLSCGRAIARARLGIATAGVCHPRSSDAYSRLRQLSRLCVRVRCLPPCPASIPLALLTSLLESCSSSSLNIPRVITQFLTPYPYTRCLLLTPLI